MSADLELQEKVESFFQSVGDNRLDTRPVTPTKPGLYIGSRYEEGEVVRGNFAWIAPAMGRSSNYETIEANLLDEISDRRNANRDAIFWIIALSSEGFSTQFRRQIKEIYDVRFRVPIQLFDTEFKGEHLTETEKQNLTQELSTLLQVNTKHRVPQRYKPYPLAEDVAVTTGEDLLSILESDLSRSATTPCLRIIIGPAGAGKSFLFRCLFKTLFEKFGAAKRRQENFSRPIPLIPQFFIGSDYGSKRDTRMLFERFTRAALARLATPETLEWSLINGYSHWMFDGLDELYSGDSEFFRRIESVLTSPNSQAQVLICARESLLTTSSDFADLLETYPPGPDRDIRVYRLEPWSSSSRRLFAWLSLEGRTPNAGEPDPDTVKEFLGPIESSASINKLASLPYFCQLLLDTHHNVRISEFSDEYAVIEYALENMLEREKRKISEGAVSFLDENCLIENGVNDFLEAIATSFYHSSFAGVSRSDVTEYAELVTYPNLSNVERERTITNLAQFPVFALGGEDTLIFRHELIAEFLAGRHWLSQFAEQPERVGEYLGDRIDFATSLIARYMAHRISQSSELRPALTDALKNRRMEGRSFANLLQILLLAVADQQILRKIGVRLDHRDLRYVRFSNLDLREISFRDSNLSYTQFIDCDLSSTDFVNSILDRTAFVGMTEDQMRGARFDGLQHFVAIQHGLEGTKAIARPAEMCRWAERVTGEQLIIQDDRQSPAFLALRTLFLKYVRPDGSARRDWHNMKALCSGKRYPGAPQPKKCVEEAIRFGYLKGPDFRDNVQRVPGARYSEMVEFVREWSISPDLRILADKLAD